MNYVEPMMDVYLFRKNNVVATSEPGFVPEQGGEGGSTPLGGASTINF